MVEVNFYSLSSFQVSSKGIKEEKTRETQETSKFFMVGKLDFYVFHA